MSKVSQSIRQMNEYRTWAGAVRERDGACVRCGAVDHLESHHKTPFAELLARHEIKTREQARQCGELWDISNGETLCERCHYKEHGRKYAD